jgi:hypothetical protein
VLRAFLHAVNTNAGSGAGSAPGIPRRRCPKNTPAVRYTNMQRVESGAGSSCVCWRGDALYTWDAPEWLAQTPHCSKKAFAVRLTDVGRHMAKSASHRTCCQNLGTAPPAVSTHDAVRRYT